MPSDDKTTASRSTPKASEVREVALYLCRKAGDPDNCSEQYLDYARWAIEAIDVLRYVPLGFPRDQSDA